MKMRMKLNVLWVALIVLPLLIVSGISTASEHPLQASLAVATDLMESYGQYIQSDHILDWNAINQLTGDTESIQLPQVQLGETLIPQNSDPNTTTLLVDEVVEKVGGDSTLFQRMNEQGDMIRVATTVLGDDGQRAIGTFIPATKPDGTADTVIETVLRGETFLGRSYVVNAWYISAYQPIYDTDGNVIGLLYVGVKED